MVERTPDGVVWLSLALLLIAAFIWLARSIVRGAQGLPILTYLGVKSGTVARVHAIIYLALLVALAANSQYLWRTLWAIPLDQIAQSLLFPIQSLPLGVILITMGAATIPLVLWIVKRREAKDPLLQRNPRRRRRFRAYVWSHPLLLHRIRNLTSNASASSRLLRPHPWMDVLVHLP